MLGFIIFSDETSYDKKKVLLMFNSHSAANSGIVPDNSRTARGKYVENRKGMYPCAKWE